MPTRDEPSSSKGKGPLVDVLEIQYLPKGQRVGKEVQASKPLYSPSQSPIHVGDEHAMGEQLLQLGSLGEIACTYEEMQEGMSEEPASPKMDLTMEEFVGKELDPIIKQTNEEFLADNNFGKIGSFMQFIWRKNIDHFKERRKKRKIEQPHKGTYVVEEGVKKEMMTEFEAITPKQGREMIAKAGVLILLEWDIADALVLDVVRKETKPLEGVT